MQKPAGQAAIAWQDLGWILLALLVLVASGIGLRDPWPADEPRFAAVARDMVASGDWWFPRVGGDLYQDKPPLFMWLIAAVLSVTGSMRLAFLLPSLLAAGGTLILVHDLARRLARPASAATSRESGSQGACAAAAWQVRVTEQEEIVVAARVGLSPGATKPWSDSRRRTMVPCARAKA